MKCVHYWLVSQPQDNGMTQSVCKKCGKHKNRKQPEKIIWVRTEVYGNQSREDALLYGIEMSHLLKGLADPDKSGGIRF